MLGKKRKIHEIEEQPEEEAVVEEQVEEKPVAPGGNFNKDLTDALMEVAITEKNKGQINKYHVYLKAIHELKIYPRRITSGEEARKLNGIGKKISCKIQELLDTGTLRRLETARGDERTVAINLISRIAGIGPKSAAKFVDEDGVRTLEDMRKHQDKLTHHQKIGLKYFEDLELKVPRAEVGAIEKIVKEEAAELDSEITCSAVGSYRRGLPESGDIDILMTHPDYTTEKKDRKDPSGLLKNLVKKLEARGLIKETISLGFMQFMGICRLPGAEHFRHLDIKLFPAESFHCGLLHFTGSGEHNRQMSIAALKMKFFLNEFMLCPVGSTGVKGEPFPITSEEDIFALLGMDYVPPEKRNL